MEVRFLKGEIGCREPVGYETGMMVIWEMLKTSGSGIVDRLNSFLGDWLEGSYWLYVEEGVREKLSNVDLKLLAWATKWMVMSLTEVGNRGVRGCSIWGKMNSILVCQIWDVWEIQEQMSNRLLDIWILSSVESVRISIEWRYRPRNH